MLGAFYKKHKNDEIWWIDDLGSKGHFLFSFDKKQIFNFFRDYPDKLTKEQKKNIRQREPNACGVVHRCAYGGGKRMSVKFTSYKKEVLSHIEESIDRALDICGGTAERHAKENLTKNESVKTNRLRGSMTHIRADKNTEAVGTNVEYAPYVELGHHQEPGRYVPAIKKRLVASWVPPKPYLRPAVEEHKAEYEKIIQTELSK